MAGVVATESAVLVRDPLRVVGERGEVHLLTVETLVAGEDAILNLGQRVDHGRRSDVTIVDLLLKRVDGLADGFVLIPNLVERLLNRISATSDLLESGADSGGSLVVGVSLALPADLW